MFFLKNIRWIHINGNRPLTFELDKTIPVPRLLYVMRKM